MRPATGIDLFSDLQMYSAVFSRPTQLWFSAGAPSKQTITLNSTPYKSNVFVDETNGGTLKSNTDFEIINGQGTPDFNTLQIKFNGNPAAANQDYTLNVYAAVFPLKETYTISVRNQLKITSPGYAQRHGRHARELHRHHHGFPQRPRLPSIRRRLWEG